MDSGENKEQTPDEVIPPKETSFFESQTFRIMTIGLYLAGVGGMGMMLAFYFLFLWDSRMPPIPEIKPHHHFG